MAPPALQKAIGGVTPLGIITITSGIPQKVTTNLNIVDTNWAFTCRQLGFSVDSGATGQVFVNYQSNAGGNIMTALVLQKNQQQTLPMGTEVVDSVMDATQWYLDGSHTGDKVAVYALDASS